MKVKIEIKQEPKHVNPYTSRSNPKKEEMEDDKENMNVKPAKVAPVKREYKDVENATTPRRSSRRAKQPKRFDQSV